MGVSVIDRIRRGESTTAPFAVAWEDDLRVGYTSVVDLTARNAIPEWKRVPFMTVYVVSTDTEYKLGADTSISGQTWTVKSYGVPDNVVTEDEIFDVNGLIKSELIGNIFLGSSYVVDSEVAMLALTTYTGNFIIRTDTSDIYVKINDTNPATLSDFSEITYPGAVTSVNGQTGNVNITVSSLLAVSSNLTYFNSAVDDAPAVNDLQSTSALHSAQIAALQSATEILGGYSVVMNNGSLVTARANLNILNGLTATDNAGLVATDVSLGGSLQSNTVIALNGKTLEISNGVTGIVFSDLLADSPGKTSITGQYWDFSFQNGASAGVGGNVTFTDSRTTRVGIQYASDYSADLSNLSLTHKSYVLGAKTYTGAQTFKAGEAGVGLAPVYLQTGVALTTPADGALEYDSSHLYFTIGSTRYQLDQQGGGGWATTGTTTLTGGVTIAQATNNLSFLNGNVLFGPTSSTITPSTKIDIRGTGTGTNKALRIADSDNTEKFVVQDNGQTTFYTTASLSGGAVQAYYFSQINSAGNPTDGAFMRLHPDVRTTTGISSNWEILDLKGFYYSGSASSQSATGLRISTSLSSWVAEWNSIKLAPVHTISSGTGTSSQIRIVPTYNYTGTYSGTVYGVLYNPTLTSMTGVTHIAAAFASGDVVIGNTVPTTSAALDIQSTTKAFIPPRMTTTQKNAIPSPSIGMLVVDSTESKLFFHNGTAWESYTRQQLKNATTNSIDRVTYIEHLSSGTAANGFGGSFGFALQNSTGSSIYAGDFENSWINATSGSEFSKMSLRLLRFSGNVYPMSWVGENVVFHTNSTIDFKSLLGGSFISDVTTIPTGNPTAGLFRWSSPEPEGSNLKIRTSGGHFAKPTLYKKLTISSGSLQTIGTVPVEIIAAPGANKYINIISVSVSYKYNSTVFDFSGTEIPVFKISGGTAGFKIGTAIMNGAASFNRTLQVDASFTDYSLDTPTNTAFVLTTADGGNASTGDGDLDISVYYTIEDTNT